MLKGSLLVAGLIAGVIGSPLSAAARDEKQGVPRAYAGSPDGSDEQQPQTQPSEQEQIEALNLKVRILERLHELEQDKANEKEKTAVVASAGKDGFSIKSADGSFLFKFRMLLHADLRAFGANSHAPITILGQDPTAFLLRRGRPIFEGTVFNFFDFKVIPDFAEGKTVLQDAYVGARFRPGIALVIGKMKTPVGLERLQSASNIVFIERALPTDIVPNRDLGVQVTGEVFNGTLSYSLGAFNGVTDGASSDIDLNKGKDLVARIFARPLRQNNASVLQGLGLGIAATTGHQDGALPAFYRTIGQQFFFSYGLTTSADGSRTRISPQGYFYLNSLGVMAEYATSSQRLRKSDVRGEVRNSAWQVTGSYILTGEKASYGGFSPAKPFNPKEGSWGAFEVAARYSQLDVDAAAFTKGFADPTKSAQQARAWGLAFNWYMNRFIKYAIDYDHTVFKGGAVTGNRPAEKVVMFRCQLAF